MTPFVPDSAGLPLKWFRHPPRGRWVYTLDMFAADKGPAQITLGVQAWVESSLRIRPKQTISPSWYMGSVGYTYEDELPEWVRERMAVLNIAEEGKPIDQVGVRYDDIRWKSTSKHAAITMEKVVLRENRWYLLDVYTP